MEYISKKIGNTKKYQNLFNIAKEKGYNGENEIEQLIKWIFNWVYNYTPPNDEERLLYTTEWLEFWYNTLIPELTNIKIQDCTTCKHYISKNEVLESCANYDIFVPKHKGWKCDKYIDKIQTNEFVLEGFVGMLLNWISENTNYHLYIDCGAKGFYYWTINRYKERDWIGGSDNKSFKTIQQARHEGILQIFSLLKNQ